MRTTTLASALLLTTAAACSVNTAPIAGSRVPSKQLFADGGAQIVMLGGKAGAAAPAGGSKRDAEVVPTASPDGGMAPHADEDAGPAASSQPDAAAVDATVTVDAKKPELGRTCDECEPEIAHTSGPGRTMPCASGYACVPNTVSALGGYCFPLPPVPNDNPKGISCYMLLADPADPQSNFGYASAYDSHNVTWTYCEPLVNCANWAVQYPSSPL